jgi:ACS family hexuronate transporter-like MFS transporter
MAAAPVVTIVAVSWGWRSAFVVTGGIGFVWLAAWWCLYQLPGRHPRISKEELALITEDSFTSEGTAKRELAVPLGKLFRMRETWGCILVRALTDPISYFLLFWVPLYFQKRHGFDLKQLGMFVWIPFAAAAIGSIAGGALPRFLIGLGWELDKARKATMSLMTVLIFICAILATQASHAGLAMVLVASMMFCHAGWGNMTLPAEIFPKNAVGTVTGLGGTLGSWMGALSQISIGWVVDSYGFTPIFIACAGLYPIALLLVFLLIGKLGVTREIA